MWSLSLTALAFQTARAEGLDGKPWRRWKWREESESFSFGLGRNIEFRGSFISVDLVVVYEGSANKVKAIHEGLLGDLIDFEFERFVVYDKSLVRKVYRRFSAAASSSENHVLVSRKLNKQQTAIGGVLSEDIAISG
jgi:hypothetical protein